jgi:hypothetical protein
VSSLVNGPRTVSLDSNSNLTFTNGEQIKTNFLGGGIELYQSSDNTIGIYPGGAEIKTFTTDGPKYKWLFGITGNTTFPTGLILGAPRGVNTVNFTAAIDKEFQIETGTASTSKLWQFGTTGTTTFPSGLTLHRLSTPYSNITADLDKILQVATQTSGGRKEWSFGTDGTTTFPTNISINYGSGGNVQFPRIIADSGKAFSVQGQGTSGSAALSWTVDPDAAGQYAAVAVTRAGGGNLATVVLQAQSNSGDVGTVKLWRFDETGVFTLPAGGVISEGGGLTGAIKLTPAGGANANQALLIYPTAAGDGDHIHLTAGGGTTELYLGNDSRYVKLVNGGNIEVRATTANASSSAAWTFGTDGAVSTTKPLIINVTNGIPTGVGAIAATTGSWELNLLSNLATTGGSGSGLRVNVTHTGGYASTIAIATAGTGYLDGELITVTSGSSSASFIIAVTGTRSWTFGTDGALTLPGTLKLPDASVISSYKPVTVISLAILQVFTNGQSDVPVIFVDTVDSANAFGTNGTFTVPYTGYYQFNVNIVFTANISISSGFLTIANTTSGITTLDTLFAGQFVGQVINASSMLELTAGNTIKIFFRQVGAVDPVIDVTSRLTIHRVSIN